jgi:hypothetical protein
MNPPPKRYCLKAEILKPNFAWLAKEVLFDPLIFIETQVKAFY